MQSGLVKFKPGNALLEVKPNVGGEAGIFVRLVFGTRCNCANALAQTVAMATTIQFRNDDNFMVSKFRQLLQTFDSADFMTIDFFKRRIVLFRHLGLTTPNSFNLSRQLLLFSLDFVHGRLIKRHFAAAIVLTFWCFLINSDAEQENLFNGK